MHTILHVVFGYFFLLLTVRVLSRRPGAQLTPFEFVIVFLVGGVIIASTVGDDRSLTNAIGGVFTVGFLHRLVGQVKQHYPRLGAWIDGTPLPLLQDGVWQTEILQKMRVQDTDVMAVARSKGYRSLDQVKYAVLERNGAITVIPREEK